MQSDMTCIWVDYTEEDLDKETFVMRCLRYTVRPTTHTQSEHLLSRGSKDERGRGGTVAYLLLVCIATD